MNTAKAERICIKQQAAVVAVSMKENSMNITELAKKLAEMYKNAPEGDRVAMIHLFGIRYAKEIKENHYASAEIVKTVRRDFNSHFSASYDTEINKGIKLAKYVKEI